MRGQISIEFIIIFAGLFLFFIMAAAFLPGQLRQREDPQEVAHRMLEEFKLHAIFASTTTQEYEANLPLATQIGGEPIQLRIFPEPDNTVQVIRARDGKVLASMLFPAITETTDDAGVVERIIIRRNEGVIKVVT